ncbi:MAG: NosD domain-containing protein [Candidatus Helarchaeota archaeon]
MNTLYLKEGKKYIKSKPLNLLFLACCLIGIIIPFSTSFNILVYNIGKFNQFDNKSTLKSSGFWNLTGNPIVIDNLDPTKSWVYTASNYGWCSGSGTYSDPYLIENVTIDGQGSSNCIEIRNSFNVYFKIRNCTLYNSGDGYSGIYLNSTFNGTIEYNDLYNNYHRITMIYCNNLTIFANYLRENAQYGAYVDFSNDIKLIGNIIYKNDEFGIYMWGSSNCTLSHNIINSDGVFMMGDKVGLTSHSIDTTNLVNGKPLYYHVNQLGLKPENFTNAGQIILVNCNDSKISNLIFSKTDIGVSIHYSNNITISNITVSNSLGGIFLDSSKNSTIFKNTMNDCYAGIYLFGSVNCTLNENIMNLCGVAVFGPKDTIASHIIDTSNIVNGNPVYYYSNTIGLAKDDFVNAGQIILANCNNSMISELNINKTTIGIALLYSNNNTISDNVMNDNKDSGLYIFSSKSNTFIRNVIYNSRRGFYLWACDNNTFLKNTIKNNVEDGIYMVSGDYNVFSENIIRNNRRFGVSTSGVNNVFYKNYFVNNTKHSLDLSTKNFWNNSQIGNFWDNYTGVDVDMNGIGDTPHVFPGGTDYLPIVDNIPPKIVIIAPLNLEVFEDTVPDYILVVTENETLIDSMWYTLDNGLTNITFSKNGTINLAIWNVLPNGNVTIKFYVKDLAGNIGFAKVVVIKKSFQPIPIAIPGYNFFLLLGAISFAIVLIQKRKQIHTN